MTTPAEQTAKQFQARFVPATLNKEARTVEVVWTTGADAPRRDPVTGQLFIERLRVNEESVDLTRLRLGAPVLDSHGRGSVREQIGVVTNAWITPGKGHATIQFSARALDLFGDVADGVLRNISVGYAVDESNELDERSGGLPIVEAVKWTPYELSLVSIGADPGAQIRSQADEANHQRNISVMDQDTVTPQPSPGAVAAERKRVSAILDAADKMRVPQLFARSLIDDGVSLDAARAAIIDEAAKNVVHIDTHFVPGDGKREADFVQDAAEGLLVRERILKDTTSPGAREFVNRSIVDVAEHSLQMAGHNTRSIRDKHTLIERGFITSSTLGSVLATFSTRSLLSGYEAVPRTFIDAFRESSARNFKPNERARVSDTPALALVNEGSNFLETTLSDSKESFSIAKYGHILKYTIEALVNDDLGATAREAERAGFAAATTEGNVFWGVITANATMSDSVALFAAAKSNLVGPVTLSADALEDAREYFRTARTEHNVKLNLAPKFLFVSPTIERTAEKLVRPPINHSAAALTDVLGNSFASSLQLIVEPRLPDGDWLVTADFRQIDTVEYAWLEGRRGVHVDQDGDFDSMGIKFRVSDFFGAGAVDRRGMYYQDATLGT